MTEFEAAWLNVSHAIEYDPTWPDGLPNYCIHCDEALAEGDEMCGHNTALTRLVEAARAIPAAPAPPQIPDGIQATRTFTSTREKS